jgi:hypothetical protein
MIKIPNECPDDTQLIGIVTAIKVVHGTDVFKMRGFRNLAKVRINYKAFNLWLAANYGELSKYGDTDAYPGVESQIEAGQGTESHQGSMVL